MKPDEPRTTEDGPSAPGVPRSASNASDEQDVDAGLRRRKLELECVSLEQQTSRRHRITEAVKVVISAGGLLAALAALIGAFVSTQQWLANEKATRDAALEK